MHCWDRDCSLQHRHQKLVEEACASTFPQNVRNQLGEAAVRLARTVGYVNAGTCEFLVDADNKFYFIEVNARIQVEHPVTEMVTGIDLVKQQIRIAAGMPLPFRQKEIVARGHAIECRINSEDPDNDFRPSPGRITELNVPGGPGVRWDSHVQAGYSVPPNYDSLLGKLIVHAPTRVEAIATMRRALDELSIEGVKTTIPMHRRIFRNSDFLDGKVDTTWVERVFMNEVREKGPGGRVGPNNNWLAVNQRGFALHSKVKPGDLGFRNSRPNPDRSTLGTAWKPGEHSQTRAGWRIVAGKRRVSWTSLSRTLEGYSRR